MVEVGDASVGKEVSSCGYLKLGRSMCNHVMAVIIVILSQNTAGKADWRS